MIRNKQIFTRTIATCFLLTTLPTMLVQHMSARSLSVDDILANAEIKEVVVSPDGSRLAVVVQRGRGAGEYLMSDYLSSPRCDIWIVTADGRTENLTQGKDDASTSFSPVWSVDGTKLAFLSDKGGDNIRIYVWYGDRAKPQRVTELGVDTTVNFGGRSESAPSSLAWLDENTVLTVLLPAGESPVNYRYDFAVAKQLTDWAKTRRGVDPSVSVLGGDASMPTRTLVGINVKSSEQEVIGEGSFQAITVSPDRRWLAVVEDDGPLELRQGELTSFLPLRGSHNPLEYRRGVILVIRSDGHSSVRRVEGVFNPISWATVGLPRWNSDSKIFAVLAKSDSHSGLSPAPTELFVVDAESTRATRVLENVQDFAWSRTDLLALTDDGVYRVGGPSTSRLESKDVPVVPDRSAFAWSGTVALMNTQFGALCVVRNQLGYLGASGFTPLKSHNETRKVDRIIWPDDAILAQGSISDLIIESSHHLYHISLGDGDSRWQLIEPPTPTAVLADYSQMSHLAAFVDTSGTEQSLLVGRNSGQSYMKPLSLNHHWKEIEDPEERIISYNRDDGASLAGVLEMPYGYRSGQKYPLIVCVYPGVVFTPSGSLKAYTGQVWKKNPLFAKQYAGWFNLAKFTSQGYLVFLPSIPLPSGRVDISAELMRNVVPGVEKLVREGVTEPGKIGLRGHSYGSLVSLLLIEQTNIFSAAITSANYVDLIAFHGYLHPDTRHSPVADSYSRARFAETEAPNGALRILKTPTEDMTAYIRNSPIFGAGRIRTPLLLIHGEFDVPQIEGAESMYSTLRENGVPAQLVRYWGEGHGIESPANIRDDWQREVDWFDFWLKRQESPGSPNATQYNSWRRLRDLQAVDLKQNANESR